MFVMTSRNGNDYAVKFMHREQVVNRKRKFVTECRIKSGVTGTKPIDMAVMGKGYSIKRDKENNFKTIGKEYALKHACENLSNIKDIEKELTDAFYLWLVSTGQWPKYLRGLKSLFSKVSTQNMKKHLPKNANFLVEA